MYPKVLRCVQSGRAFPSESVIPFHKTARRLPRDRSQFDHFRFFSPHWVLALMFTRCDSEPIAEQDPIAEQLTASDASAIGVQSPDDFLVTQTAEIGPMAFRNSTPAFDPTPEEIDGTASLSIGSKSSFTLKVMARGFEPDHAETLWIFDDSVCPGGALEPP